MKIGLLGAGHLGQIHMKLLKTISYFELIGFYDPDKAKSEHAEVTYQIPAYQSIENLLADVEVVDIVTPTLSHFKCAEQAIRKGKHVFIEKPMTNTAEEAEILLKLVQEAGIKVQVGHVERYNPAYLAALEYELKPVFIESHRLAKFQPRGTDVSVILDLMIHDIDIALNLVGSTIKYISASGVGVVSDNPDIASVRIEFANGVVANLTASRISLKQERKMRIFQKSAYVTIDFQDKKANVFKMRNKSELGENPYYMELNTGDGKSPKVISYESPDSPEVNAIQMELESFAEAIKENREPQVSVEDGYEALMVAHKIVDKVNAIKVDE